MKQKNKMKTEKYVHWKFKTGIFVYFLVVDSFHWILVVDSFRWIKLVDSFRWIKQRNMSTDLKTENMPTDFKKKQGHLSTFFHFSGGGQFSRKE